MNARTRRLVVTVTCVALMCAVPATAPARNTKYMLPIDAALDSAAAREALGTSVRFYFGNQSHPPVERRMGEWVSNRKTNAFVKSDREACERVFHAGAILAGVALKGAVVKLAP